LTDGYELRTTPGKGEGIFATQQFKRSDIVMVGVIEKTFSKNHSHASQIGEHKFALHAGSIRMVNHSCEPNCGIVVNESGGHDFVAMGDINIGDEISFDYAMRNYRVDYFPPLCMCGSDLCRGEITGWTALPADTKAKYQGFVPPYILELDARDARAGESDPVSPARGDVVESSVPA